MECATDISLKQILYDHDVHAWPQIQVAFQVRHLVEHSDGKVDKQFVANVKHTWRNSTWGQCGPSVTIGQKIGVNEQDVTATYEVMVEATTLLTQRLVQWASES